VVKKEGGKVNNSKEKFKRQKKKKKKIRKEKDLFAKLYSLYSCLDSQSVITGFDSLCVQRVTRKVINFRSYFLLGIK